MNEKKKKKESDITIVNIFKNPEEERRSLFLDTMAKTIAGSEKNLTLAKFENVSSNW